MPDNYLIIGDDEYFRGKEISGIRDKYLSSGETELNYSSYGPDDLEGAMDSLGTMPFLADKRVVLVSGAEDLSEEGAATLIAYLEKPSPTSVLVLSGAASLSKSKFYKKLSALASVTRADTPKPFDLKKRVNSFFKKAGVGISPRAVELLVELKNDDTTGIKEELDKLIAFADGERIEAAHVEALVGRSPKETVFKLVDAINARDAAWAFRTLNDLYEQKKRPEEIAGYLGWYLRAMRRVVFLLSKGAGGEAIGAELGMPPWQVKRFLEQSRRYNPEKLEKWVDLLYETDRSIKTGRKKPALALEMLIAQYLKG